ncbi:MAG: hypothetical protein P4M15_05250, partial [Alphaproteobacteria bacterium]|nr:hypothetical protein [Alphaproteobacteria bacterium]
FVEEGVTTSHVFCRSLLGNGETYVDAQDRVQRAEIPYLINAGAGLVAEWLDGWTWGEGDLRFLAQQDIADGKGGVQPLFENDFLHWLSRQRLTLDIDAVGEGELIFPQEPALRIKGLWWQQEMVEAANLQLISSSTNLATVAVQVRLAAQRQARRNGAGLVTASTGDIENAGLAEMALRRSPGIGGIQSLRAAAIAGWDTTSNVYGAKCYGRKAMGTFAHAWVMLHDTEEEAFDNWARVFPGATVFLADTFETLEGVRTAIRICKKHHLDLRGVRLDSGDMDYLSAQARALLNEAGYPKALILATDSINRKSAGSIYQTTQITGMGIGSEVAVNRIDPLLGFVQKLAARFYDHSSGRDELLREFIKLSESPEKTTLPGEIEVIRYIDPKGKWAGDTIIPKNLDVGEGNLSRDILSVNNRTGGIKPFPKGAPFRRLLQPWMQDGVMVQKNYAERDASAILDEAAATCRATLGRLDAGHKVLPPGLPRRYGVGIVRELVEGRDHTIQAIRMQTEMQRQRARFALAGKD